MAKVEGKKKMKLRYKLLLMIIFVFLIIGLIVGYAYTFGNKDIEIREYSITNKKLSDAFYGFKIVHISDLHYQKNDLKKLKEIVKKINETKPDLILFTGDFLNVKTSLNKQEEDKVVNVLNELKATVGKFYISGDEDIKNKQSPTLLNRTSFISLNDNYEKIYYRGVEYLLITGASSINDKTNTLQNKLKTTDDYLKGLKKSDEPVFKILLVHEPDIVNSLQISDYDLILAGHNHNGQVKNLNVEKLFLPANGKIYYKPYQTVKKRPLYISGGLGNNKYNLRLFNHPSINLYRLKNK